MSVRAAELRHDAPVAPEPARRVHVLIQTEPSFQVLATADDPERLEVERQILLDLPWDQDESGQREISILSSVHLGQA